MSEQPAKGSESAADGPPTDRAGQTPERGLLLVISGPSGVGKTTLTHRVQRRLGAGFSVSMTTRTKTEADREGVHYHFVNEPTFTAARDRGELLEWAKVFDNYYGTPRGPVERHLARGRLMILEIDVAGAEQVKKNMPEALALFVEPPSHDVLLTRLRQRKREDEATIQKRFARARDEIGQAHGSGVYDRFIINDQLDHAVDEAVAAVEARRGGKNSAQ